MTEVARPNDSVSILSNAFQWRVVIMLAKILHDKAPAPKEACLLMKPTKQQHR